MIEKGLLPDFSAAALAEVTAGSIAMALGGNLAAGAMLIDELAPAAA